MIGVKEKKHIIALAVAVLYSVGPADAAQHFWDLNEVYSNSDGSVQFVEMFANFNNQQFLTNHQLTSTGSADFVFPRSSPAPTANHNLLIATGPISGVSPDFTLPANFLNSGIGNVLRFTNPGASTTWDSINLDSLPTDDTMSLDAIFNNGNNPGAFAINAQATPTNYAGQTATLSEPSTVDCNGDGVVDVADLGCVSTIEERDIVLGVLNALPGDLDGNGDVAFADFLVLSANFGQDLDAYTAGNIDLANGVGFPDFLVLSANFGQSRAAPVPEPSGLVLLLVGVSLIGAVRQPRELSHV